MKDIKQSDVKPGYKKTPVGVIPEEWDFKRFGHFLNFKNGVNASKEDYGNGVKFINVLEVLNNISLNNEQIPGEVEITDSQFNRYKVIKGDILFNRTSETQDEIALSSIYLDDYPTVFGGFVIRGRFTSDVYLDEFKKYIFRSQEVRKQIISKGQGAVRVNIGQTDLEKIYSPIPPLPEQKAIADCLSTWDEAIQLQEKLINAKKEQKKGLMQGFFNGQLTIKDGKLIKAKEGEDFTEEWEEVRLRDFLNESKISSEFNDKTKRLSVRLHLGGIEERELRGTESDNTKFYIRKAGQFIYGKQNFHNGAMGIIPEKYDFYETTSDIPSFDINHRVNHQWLFYFLSRKDFYQRMENKTTGTGSKRLHPKEFLDTLIKTPNKHTQITITQFLQSAEKEIEILEEKLEQLKLQKKGLMQLLLTGEKRLLR